MYVLLLKLTSCIRKLVFLKRKKEVGPALAQLVERLAHRYSESTSLTPGNLTSATVCGDRTACMPATKRSASVAPEVDHWGTYITFASAMEIRQIHSGFETHVWRHHQKSKQGYQWPQKRICVRQKL